MVGETEEPVVQRRRLRTELRALRRKKGDTQEAVAGAMDWSTSKVLRIENGDVRAAPSDVRLLAMHYGASERKVEQLVAMARAARDDTWPAFRDVHQPASLNFFGLEAAASLVRDFSLTLVPGLLQTEAYARKLLADMSGYGEDEVDRRWVARARRQELLERAELPELFFLLDEGVLRRVPTVPVMLRQVEHLLAIGEFDRVSLRVIPFAKGVHPGMLGSFKLLEFPNPDDDDVLYLEHVDGDKVIREEPDVTSRYTQRFFDLEKLAMSESDTRALLESIRRDLGGGGPAPSPQKAEVTS